MRPAHHRAQAAAELDASKRALPKKLDAAKSATMSIEKLTITRSHSTACTPPDRMAHDKLKEGIEGFSKGPRRPGKHSSPSASRDQPASSAHKPSRTKNIEAATMVALNVMFRPTR